VPLRIVYGGEIALERVSTLGEDLDRFTLAQTGRYLLIEFPDFGWPLALDATIQRLRARGTTAVLGHPERNGEVRQAPHLLAEAVEQGALVQVTAGAIEGRFGRSQQRTARRLFELGLVHVLASDAHGPSVRAGGIAVAAAAVGDPELARYVTELVPAAIVAGEALPTVPRPSRSRFRAILKRQY
jgi:protein-tyrosine phosphatase